MTPRASLGAIGLLAATLLPVGCRADGSSLNATPPQGSPQVWIAEADGTRARQLTDWPGEALPLDWSPDGRTVLVQSDRDGDSDLWLAPADGSEAAQLTNEPGFETFASYSPDGLQVVFTDNFTVDGDLWIVNIDGSGMRKLGGASGRDDWAPDWSPDGSTIAFTRTPQGRIFDGEIWLINPDGTGARRLAIPIDGAVWARWAPDGRRLLVATADGFVLTVGSDGTGPHEVPGVARAWTPTWAPDGTLLAAIGGRFADNGAMIAGPDLPRDIWKFTTDGDLHVLTRTDADESLALPSPDSRHIAFARTTR